MVYDLIKCYVTLTGMRNLHPYLRSIKWSLLAKVSAYILYNWHFLQFTHNNQLDRLK